MQIYETNIGILASVMKALAPHFGAYALYNTDDLDILIIATRGAALRIPDERLLQSQPLRAELERIGVQSVADIQSRKIGDNLTIGPLLQAIAVPANSDFFPFVDLNAPRLRYMRENALDLPALTMLPFPFLELLDGAARRAPTAEPAANSVLVRDRLVRRALEVRRAVSSDSFDNLDPQTAAYLAHIDMSRERCAEEAQSTWKIAVRNISDYTAAFLSPGELEEIWNKVIASPCYRDVSGDHRMWADLFAAIARRDAPQIVRFGTALLGQQSLKTPPELAYLTTITAAAYVRMGEKDQARGLLQAQERSFPYAGPFEFALRDLLALTRAAGNAKVTQVAR
jgi:hypothetical protein